MSLYVCRRCTTRFAVGLHRCPQCTAEDAYLLDNEDVQVLGDPPVESGPDGSGDGAVASEDAKAPAKAGRAR